LVGVVVAGVCLPVNFSGLVLPTQLFAKSGGVEEGYALRSIIVGMSSKNITHTGAEIVECGF